MWRKNAARFLILALTSVLLSPGCATLTRRKAQRIPVTSSPTGATVIVNGVEQGVTPLEIRLASKQKGQVIRIESPGYNPVEIRVRRKFSGVTVLQNVVAGVVLGMPIGIAVYQRHEPEMINGLGPWAIATGVIFGVFMIGDYTTDKGYDFGPSELELTLTKMDAAPKLDTMLVDPDELRNVKWIRVRGD